jgi:hypothetical protein
LDRICVTYFRPREVKYHFTSLLSPARVKAFIISWLFIYLFFIILIRSPCTPPPRTLQVFHGLIDKFIIYTWGWYRREAKNTVIFLFTQPRHWSKKFLPNLCVTVVKHTRLWWQKSSCLNSKTSLNSLSVPKQSRPSDGLFWYRMYCKLIRVAIPVQISSG